jgi:hypothetical protein
MTLTMPVTDKPVQEPRTLTLPVIAEPVQESFNLPVPHTLVLAGTRFWCIQSDCDYVHHWWCRCDDHAPLHAG